MKNFWKKGILATTLVNLLIFLIAAALLGYSVSQYVFNNNNADEGEEYAFIAYNEKGAVVPSKITLDSVPPSDIEQVPWASQALTNLSTMGILKKDEYGRIKPKEKITRKELAVIISEIRDLPAESIQVTQDIGDVDADDPMAPYVQAVIDAGIMDDIKEFNVYARKMDVVKAVVKMDSIPVIKNKTAAAKKDSPYRDVELTSEEYPYVEAAFEQGIIVEAPQLNGDEQVDKATAAVLLNKSNFTAQKAEQVQQLVPNLYSNNNDVIVYGQQDDQQQETDPLIITYPQGYTLVEDNSISVEGISSIKPLYINDKQVSVGGDNSFSAQIKLEEGKNIIIVRNELAKRIIYVQYETNIEQRVIESQSSEQALYLQNYQPFIDQPQNLQLGLSRAEAAKILADIGGPIPKIYDQSRFNDLKQEHRFFQEINYAYDQDWLDSSSKQIRPNKPISYLEAVISLVRFGGFKPAVNTTSVPFSGVRQGSTAARYLSTALNRGIIAQRTTRLNVNNAISRQQFLTMLFNLSKARENLNQNLTNGQNLAVPRKVTPIIKKKERSINDQPARPKVVARSGESIITRGEIKNTDPADNKQTLEQSTQTAQRAYRSSEPTRYAHNPEVNKLAAQQQKESSGQNSMPAANVSKLKVFTPINNSTVTNKIITVKGVTNKGVARINGNNYKPVGNRFSQEIELKPGKNVINVSDGFDHINIKVIRLITYEDISNLKRNKEIEYLATIGYFVDSQKFYPDAQVSRFELANICALVSNEKLSYPARAPFKDVGYRDPAALSSSFLKKKGLVTDDYFYPENNITIEKASSWLHEIDPSIKIKKSSGILTRKELIDLLVQSKNIKEQLQEKLF